MKQKIEQVPLRDIHPNIFNPNSMTAEIYEATVQDILQHGFVGSIQTKWCSCNIIEGKHREIVNGEHRWRAAQDPRTRLSTISCETFTLTDEEAKIWCIRLNREHGEFVPEKLAALLKDLSRTIPKEELAIRLGVNQMDISAMLNPDLAQIVAKQPEVDLRKLIPREDVHLTFIVSKEDAQTINEAIERMKIVAKCNKHLALVKICQNFLSQASPSVQQSHTGKRD